MYTTRGGSVHSVFNSHSLTRTSHTHTCIHCTCHLKAGYQWQAGGVWCGCSGVAPERESIAPRHYSSPTCSHGRPETDRQTCRRAGGQTPSPFGHTAHTHTHSDAHTHARSGIGLVSAEPWPAMHPHTHRQKTSQKKINHRSVGRLVGWQVACKWRMYVCIDIGRSPRKNDRWRSNPASVYTHTRVCATSTAMVRRCRESELVANKVRSS
mmetsp:Transcript_42565/g.106259  ORF Transcript_42565/g.106259 Transcript_42565/m.106259 type:complete len:210 (+) Transcript_42565:45-674(+)